MYYITIAQLLSSPLSAVPRRALAAACAALRAWAQFAYHNCHYNYYYHYCYYIIIVIIIIIMYIIIIIILRPLLLLLLLIIIIIVLISTDLRNGAIHLRGD